MSDAKEYNKMSESAKKKEDWMNTKWRPMMGWSYMATCITDFVIFPVLWSVLQAISKGQVNIQWQPITLQGAGLYHIAMGAVLGIAAYGRTKEKLDGVAGGGNFGSTYVAPQPVNQQSQGMPSYGTPVSTTVMATYSQPQSMGGGFGNGGSFGQDSYGGGMQQAAVFTSRSGKPGPVQPDFPEI